MNAIATVTDIKTYVETKIPAPATPGSAIDTSDVCLLDYRADDQDVASVCNDFGWQSIRLVDADNNVVPHGRLELTYKDGKKVKIVPFFALILLAKQATLKLNTYSAMLAWSEQGSLKSRNSYKFVASAEQMAALEAKNMMNWEAAVNAETNSFVTWLGGFTPAIEQLPVLWECYQARAALVVLGADVYIRQVIPANDTTQPLDDPALKQANAPTSDKIGDVTISTAYTYQLVSQGA